MDYNKLIDLQTLLCGLIIGIFSLFLVDFMIEKELLDNKLISVFASDESKKLKFCSRCHLIYLLREDLNSDFLKVCPVCGETLQSNGMCLHHTIPQKTKRKYKRNLLW